MNEGCVIAIESSKQERIDDEYDGLELLDRKAFGDKSFTIWFVYPSESKSSILSKSESLSSKSSYEYSYDADSDNSSIANDGKSIADMIEQAQNMNLAMARSLVGNTQESSVTVQGANSGQESNEAQHKDAHESAASKIGKWVRSVLERNGGKDQDRSL